MIDKVEVGKKYRLIDREGFLSNILMSEHNRNLLANKDIFDENMCVVISRVDRGYGISHGVAVISPSEYRMFELVEENKMESKEPKVVTPETEVTITTTYGELAMAYWVLGRMNGKLRGKSLWTIIGDALGDADCSIHMENVSEHEHTTIDYDSVQEEWESLFFKSKEQREKERLIKDKQKLIDQLMKEIKELSGR